MSPDTGLDTGVDHRHKWLHREPEMGLMLRFVPSSGQPAFVRWGVLLSELREAAFELSEPRVSAVKSAWWAEELVRIAGGAGRHPLSVGLDPGWSWLPVAHALVERDASAGLASTPEQAWAGIEPLARSLSRLESEWFEVAPDLDAQSRALAVHLLGQRLVVGRAAEDGAGIPMSLLARHGCVPAELRESSGEPVVAEWAAIVLERLPDSLPRASLFRRFRAMLDREQLRHVARKPDRPWKPGMGSVFQAWRAARRP